MHEEQPAVVAGVYTQPYNEIIRPERVWKISKYFLRRWTPYLTPSEVWLVIGARQLSYFNERRPWFRAYDRTLAEAAGLHVKVFRRTIKKAICEGAGAIGAFLCKTEDPHYTRSAGVTRQTQTRYTIRLDDPLTPGDAAALAYWLRRNSPRRVTAESVRALLEEGASLPARALLAEDVAPVTAPVAVEGQELASAAEVVAHVFPSLQGDKSWREAAEALHTHLAAPELAHFETQYLRREWLPLLGAGPALLLTYLRSLCYHNEARGEIRDEVALQSGQLEAALQVSSRTLRRWFAKLDEFGDDAAVGRFVEVTAAVKQPNQKVLTTYRVGLRTPLTPDDLARYRQRLAANGANDDGLMDEKFPTRPAAEQRGNGQEVPHTAMGEGQIVPHAGGGEGQKVPDSWQGNGQEVAHTATGGGQKVAHTPLGGGQKVPNGVGGEGQNVAGWTTEEGSYKYYKLLLEASGLASLEELWQEEGPEEQQHRRQAWRVANGEARSSFAAVVAHGSLGAFLDRVGVQEPARSEIVAQHVGAAEAVAWLLYALQQENLERPLSYMISRLTRGDPPPLAFLQLASLSWEQWRAYAWAWRAPSLPEEIVEQFEAAPLFAEWGALYGGVAPDALPFDVGAGLADLPARMVSGARALNEAPAAGAGPLEPAPAGAHLARWQAALEELSLQMTRATFDAWLRDARLVGVEKDVYVVAVARPEAREWLENRLQETVERTVRALTEGQVRRVRFVLGS